MAGSSRALTPRTCRRRRRYWKPWRNATLEATPQVITQWRTMVTTIAYWK
jgi:hypothetical protein